MKHAVFYLKFVFLLVMGSSVMLFSASAWDAGSVKKADLEARKLQLTDEQKDVTQKEGTEYPYKNEYWNNHRDGIYVDVVSGEPLFSSKDKYDSGTGWPSFTQPLVKENVVSRTDRDHSRIEVRSKLANSHLGHVFNDGPAPTGLRYCMNSASMKFIAAEDLDKPMPEFKKQNYSEYKKLFKLDVKKKDR